MLCTACLSLSTLPRCLRICCQQSSLAPRHCTSSVIGRVHCTMPRFTKGLPCPIISLEWGSMVSVSHSCTLPKIFMSLPKCWQNRVTSPKAQLYNPRPRDVAKEQLGCIGPWIPYPQYCQKASLPLQHSSFSCIHPTILALGALANYSEQSTTN